MQWLLSLALALCGLAATVVWPDPPRGQPTDRVAHDDDLVTLRGCLTGRTFVVNDASGIRDGSGEPLIGVRFRLEATRAMLDALDDHSGHEEEITGTFDRADVARANDERLLAEKRLGRVRIFAGRRRSVGSDRPTRQAPVPFELDSFEHLRNRCPR